MDELQIGALACGFFLLMGGLMYWQFARGRALLNDWARREGYRLLIARYANFFRGPFFWTTSKNQMVYRIRAEDAAGHQREGWVRCGSFLGGVQFSSKVEVRWDDR